MKKYLVIFLSMCMILTFTFAINVPDAEASQKSTTFTFKPGCDRHKWPYKNKPLSDYNPCKIYIETTYFSRDNLSTMSADIGLGGGLAGLSQYGYNKLAKQMALRAAGGAGLLATATLISVGAELMYRSAKSSGIKGWYIERRYSYAVNPAKNDTIPTQKNISMKYIPAK